MAPTHFSFSLCSHEQHHHEHIWGSSLYTHSWRFLQNPLGPHCLGNHLVSLTWSEITWPIAKPTNMSSVDSLLRAQGESPGCKGRRQGSQFLLETWCSRCLNLLGQDGLWQRVTSWSLQPEASNSSQLLPGFPVKILDISILKKKKTCSQTNSHGNAKGQEVGLSVCERGEPGWGPK